MSFLFDAGGRRRKVARFISRVRGELLAAVAEKRAKEGLTQQSLATKLGVHRSVVNRQLNDETNLTLRSIADLAWALDKNIEFKLSDPVKNAGRNSAVKVSTQANDIELTVGSSRSVSSTSKQEQLSPGRITSKHPVSVSISSDAW